MRMPIGRRPFVPLHVTPRRLIAGWIDRQRYRRSANAGWQRAKRAAGIPRRCRNGRLLPGSERPSESMRDRAVRRMGGLGRLSSCWDPTRPPARTTTDRRTPGIIARRPGRGMALRTVPFRPTRFHAESRPPAEKGGLDRPGIFSQHSPGGFQGRFRRGGSHGLGRRSRTRIGPLPVPKPLTNSTTATSRCPGSA